MRHVLASLSALSLLVISGASANAATAHRRSHLRARQPVIAPHQGEAAPRFAVPGWSNGDTERWLDNASSQWTNG
ncbi:MAG: hypothetical protein WCA28_21145 [Bradyrhizobium sp.]